MLWDSSDARHKELCDQKRKKGLCCHFQFCITHLAVIVVARDVCSVWRLTLLWCSMVFTVQCFFFFIATVTAWPLSKIKLLQFRCFLKDSCSVIRTEIERNIFSADLLIDQWFIHEFQGKPLDPGKFIHKFFVLWITGRVARWCSG